MKLNYFQKPIAEIPYRSYPLVVYEKKEIRKYEENYKKGYSNARFL